MDPDNNNDIKNNENDAENIYDDVCTNNVL